MKQKRFAVATTTWLAIFTTVVPAGYGQSLPEPGVAPAPSVPATVPVTTTARQTPTAAKTPWRAKITASGAPAAITTSPAPRPSYQSYQTGAAPKMTWTCCARRTVYILDEAPIIRDTRAVPKANPAPQSLANKAK